MTTTTPSWGIIGQGFCPRCNDPAVLMTHSLSRIHVPDYNWNQDEDVMCFACHHQCLNMLDRYTQPRNEEGFREGRSPYAEAIGELMLHAPNQSADFVDYYESLKLCACCGDHLLSDEAVGNRDRYRTVDAQSARTNADGSTIIVQIHQHCSITPSCCGVTYVGGWGSSYHTTEMTRFEGDLKCFDCVTRILKERNHTLAYSYFQCSHCESHELLDDDTHYRFRHASYCRTCYEDNVNTCDDCGDVYWYERGHDCSYDSDTSYELIHDYSYKPRPFFFGKQDNPDERLFFGIELEVEASGGNIDETSHLVQEALGERVYLKEDGSLNHGFEIVTHPHSLQSFQKEFEWQSFARFRRAGLRSWDTDTCGLHVHVSRDAFGEPYDYRTTRRNFISSRQSHELRFIKLIYDNQRQVERLAGRSSPSYANFADKNHLVRKVKYNATEGGRHSAVNTDNDNTLEVRVFKGSLIPERVLACIEFVHAGVEYTRNLRVVGSKAMVRTVDGKMRSTALSWLAFAGYVHQNVDTYPHLTALMVKTFENDYSVE